MDALLAATLLVAIAAITPGPNNVIVMQTAARNGWRATVPVIAGIVSGGLAMLVLAKLGLGTAAAGIPGLRSAITIAGASCLLWLGGSALVQTFRRAKTDDGKAGDPAPAGMLGMFAFQFLNPKAWTMVLAVAASVNVEAGSAFAWICLVALFVIVPGMCLAVWSAFGAWIAAHIEPPVARTRFDRVMGALLILSAALLASSGIHRGDFR